MYLLFYLLFIIHIQHKLINYPNIIKSSLFFYCILIINSILSIYCILYIHNSIPLYNPLSIIYSLFPTFILIYFLILHIFQLFPFYLHSLLILIRKILIFPLSHLSIPLKYYMSFLNPYYSSHSIYHSLTSLSIFTIKNNIPLLSSLIYMIILSHSYSYSLIITMISI
jgi:hypothetical protein